MVPLAVIVNLLPTTAIGCMQKLGKGTQLMCAVRPTGPAPGRAIPGGSVAGRAGRRAGGSAGRQGRRRVGRWSPPDGRTDRDRRRRRRSRAKAGPFRAARSWRGGGGPTRADPPAIEPRQPPRTTVKSRMSPFCPQNVPVLPSRPNVPVPRSNVPVPRFACVRRPAGGVLPIKRDWPGNCPRAPRGTPANRRRESPGAFFSGDDLATDLDARPELDPATDVAGSPGPGD